MASFGTAVADPGNADTGRLTIGESRDGSTIGLPVAVVNGTRSGKTLYIQAASDGNELNGVGVVRRLYSRLDPALLSGTIYICGIVNYHGFQVAEHRNPLDDKKINRTYPGDTSGSSSERIAAATYETASEADLILDLHQGSTSKMLNECRVRCGKGHRLHDDCLELAKVFGTGYILDMKGPKGQLARVAPDDGIPTVDPELGGAVGLDQESIEKGINGIFNVLRYYDFLIENYQPATQTRARSFDYFTSPTGGLIDFHCSLGDEVSRNDVLFKVTDTFGQQKDTVVADSAGIFWRCRRLPQVATGEYVCSVGRNIGSY